VDNSLIAGFFFGATLLYAPIELQAQIRKVARRTKAARGRIVDATLHHTTSESGSATSPGTWHAVVAFEVHGRTVQFVSGIGKSWQRPHVGSTVSLHYDPAEPQNAEVDGVDWHVLTRGMQVVTGLAGLCILGWAFWTLRTGVG
jgi:hypothetical protein